MFNVFPQIPQSTLCAGLSISRENSPKRSYLRDRMESFGIPGVPVRRRKSAAQRPERKIGAFFQSVFSGFVSFLSGKFSSRMVSQARTPFGHGFEPYACEQHYGTAYYNSRPTTVYIAFSINHSCLGCKEKNSQRISLEDIKMRDPSKQTTKIPVHTEGQTFTTEGAWPPRPEGFCEAAWQAMYPYI